MPRDSSRFRCCEPPNAIHVGNLEFQAVFPPAIINSSSHVCCWHLPQSQEVLGLVSLPGRRATLLHTGDGVSFSGSPSHRPFPTSHPNQSCCLTAPQHCALFSLCAVSRVCAMQNRTSTASPGVLAPSPPTRQSQHAPFGTLGGNEVKISRAHSIC